MPADSEQHDGPALNVPPLPGDGQPLPSNGDAAGADPLRGLLRLASEELDKESETRNLRVALDYLERYRREALATEQPELVFDTIPVARAIERMYTASGSAQRDARQFIDSTARYLGKWPELAREYEQRLLEDDLEQVEARRGSPVAKLIPALGGVVSVVGVVMIIAASVQNLEDGFLIAGIAAVPAGLMLAGLASVWKRARDAQLAAEAENLRRKLNLRSVSPPGSATAALTPAGAQTPSGEYFGNLVTINVENLSDYYYQVRVHTNNSFWASIVAGGLGFVLIAAGLVLGVAKSNADAISFVATGSGVLVEFISGVFFYLYNRTVRQLKEYHDSLLDVQNILLSFRIVDQATVKQREALFEKILTFLLQQRGQRDAAAP